jgi:transposase-like protein
MRSLAKYSCVSWPSANAQGGQMECARTSLYFQYPEDIRRVIYTTNIIESVHRQFRTLTKTKGAFPNDDSLLKLLFMGIKNAEKKWTMPIRNWSLTLSQLSIHFEGRLNNALNL